MSFSGVTIPEEGFDSIQGVGPNPSFQVDSCAILMAGTLTTMYIDKSGLIIQVGDRLFATNSIGAPVSGGWYVVDDFGINRRVRVGVGTGEIIEILSC